VRAEYAVLGCAARHGSSPRMKPSGSRAAWTRGLFPFLLGAALLSGCGGREQAGESAKSPVTPPVTDEPQVIFAGRPLKVSPLPCASAILIEPRTNTILYEQDARERRAPASIVKMTLELVTMREVEAGKLALSDSVRASAWASKIGGSQVYLAEGEAFTLNELMQAIAIHSANDACVAVAEHIAGTTESFVQCMNQEVEALKLTDTHYINVHGLDDEPGIGNYTTAYDISQIARELIRYPHILEWSSTVETPFRNGAFNLQNTNKLLGRFQGLDGLKTGYTVKAGFCLCATAQRQGMRLISVILGADSNPHRFQETAGLLGAGFNSYSPVTVCRAGEKLGDEVPIKGAKPKTLQGVGQREVTLVVSRPDDRRLKKEFIPAKALRAPLKAGAPVGMLKISSGDTVLAEVPVVAGADIAATGLGAWLRGVFRKG
jgi:serine-type D-Ala-D-Ala carboxypeptidase (penicillin-binding protein 5/6)